MPATGTASVAPPHATNPTGLGKPPWLLVMPLRAAEEHVLVVLGEADLSTADQLRNQLVAVLATTPVPVRIELGGLDFCDLHGLDALHDAVQAAAAAGVPLALCGMSNQLAWLHNTFPRDSVPPSGPAPSHITTSPAATSPTGPAATSPTTASRPAVPATANPRHHAAAGGGRRAGPDGMVHAVPVRDTTRSAACGARVQRPQTDWDAAHPHTCPDRSILLTVRLPEKLARPDPAPPAELAPHRRSTIEVPIGADVHLHAAAS